MLVLVGVKQCKFKWGCGERGIDKNSTYLQQCLMGRWDDSSNRGPNLFSLKN